MDGSIECAFVPVARLLGVSYKLGLYCDAVIRRVCLFLKASFFLIVITLCIFVVWFVRVAVVVLIF